MALTPTTTDALETLFVAQILATTPRITYKGAEVWKHHARPVDGPTTTRRYRLVWDYRSSEIVLGAIQSIASQEVRIEMSVRADYAGKSDKASHAISNDLHQIRDRLHRLTTPSTNGLILVEAVRTEAPKDFEKLDVVRVDHIYRVRYLQARG